MANGKEQPEGWFAPLSRPRRRSRRSPPRSSSPCWRPATSGSPPSISSFISPSTAPRACSTARSTPTRPRSGLLVADRHRPDPAPPHPPRICLADRGGADGLERNLRQACEAHLAGGSDLRNTAFPCPESPTPHARLSLPHLHPRPQHGRRPRPLARDRRQGGRFRQADHRHRQLVHPVRARPRALEGPRPARRPRGRGRRRHRQGIQHHRGRRRHRDGPRRHALFPAQPGDHRRQRRIHGQRPLRRRAGLHLQLRQDHAWHADGGAAAQRPRRVRLRRADGGRQGRDPRARSRRST